MHTNTPLDVMRVVVESLLDDPPGLPSDRYKIVLYHTLERGRADSETLDIIARKIDFHVLPSLTASLTLKKLVLHPHTTTATIKHVERVYGETYPAVEKAVQERQHGTGSR